MPVLPCANSRFQKARPTATHSNQRERSPGWQHTDVSALELAHRSKRPGAALYWARAVGEPALAGGSSRLVQHVGPAGRYGGLVLRQPLHPEQAPRSTLLSGLHLVQLVAALGLVVAVAACSPAANKPSMSVSSVPGATVNPEQRAYQALVLDRPYTLPATRMQLSTGVWRTLTDVVATAGVSLTLLSPGYTNCGDGDGACDTVMADMAQALHGVPAPCRSRIQVLMLSADPQRDTVPVLRRYMGQFGSSTPALGASRFQAARTDDPAAMQQVMRALGMSVENPAFSSTGSHVPTSSRSANPSATNPRFPDGQVRPAAFAQHEGHTAPPGGYVVTHSSQIVGVTPQGQGVMVWTPQNRTVPALRDDLQTYCQRHAQ